MWPKKEAIFISTAFPLEDLHQSTSVEDCERPPEAREADEMQPEAAGKCERKTEEADEKLVGAAGQYERQSEAREAEEREVDENLVLARRNKRQLRAREGDERLVQASQNKRQPLEAVEKVVLGTWQNERQPKLARAGGERQKGMQVASGEDLRAKLDGEPLPETFIINLSYI